MWSRQNTLCHAMPRLEPKKCLAMCPLDARTPARRAVNIESPEVNITHEHDDATFSRMMFASNPLQLCNLIPIVHRDNLRGDRNQWAYDLDNRVKASDHIGICNVMGDPAGHEVKMTWTDTGANNHG